MNATNTQSGITMERIAKRFQGLVAAHGLDGNQDVKDFGALLETFSEKLDGELNTLKTQLTDVASQVRTLMQAPKP